MEDGREGSPLLPQPGLVPGGQSAASSLLARLKSWTRVWRDIAGSAKGGETLSFAPDLPDDDLDRLRTQMRACLDAKGGEVSARARAAALGREYLSLSRGGRRRFLKLIADEFGPDRAAVDAAMAAVGAAASGIDRDRAERALRASLEPPRARLLTQFNALPEGVKFLVDMRSELMGWRKEDVSLASLEADLRALLTAWFDVGFLELQRITWRSSASVLEKIIAYEAVHAIQGWNDLKNRLDSDRRLYAFFHPRMPEEPLIFVEVALVRGIAGNVHDILDQSAPVGDPNSADTAIFYSINNAQRGLDGISFGNFLIKRVVQELTREFKQLKTFATLSPIPGFRTWLDGMLVNGPDPLAAPERKSIGAALGGGKVDLASLLADGAWTGNAPLSTALKPVLTRLSAHYLLTQKRGKTIRALDPVAHFHLSNGARVEQLNWLADTSAKGLAQSCGLMVNYLYKLDEIEGNHESYSATGKVAASSTVKSLAKG